MDSKHIHSLLLWQTLCLSSRAVGYIVIIDKIVQNKMLSVQKQTDMSVQSCPTLFHPVGYSAQVSSVHGIPQARIPKCIDMPCSRGSSWPRIKTVSLKSPALEDRFFTINATWEAHPYICVYMDVYTYIWMDLDNMLSELRHRKINTIWYQLYMGFER